MYIYYIYIKCARNQNNYTQKQNIAKKISKKNQTLN